MASSSVLPTPTPTPALPPPPGVTSNFNDPDSLAKWNVLAVTVCLTSSTVLFFLRSYVRIFIKRHWIFEDWICLSSWLGFLGYCVLMTTTMTKHGGIHEWDLTLPQVEDALYWFYVSSIVYGPVICLAKLAVLTLYRRVFVPRRGTGFDIFLVLTMVILVMFYVAITFAKIFECTPTARAWDKSHAGTCIDVGSLLNASGMFNTITDFAILLIPIKSVWALNMKRRQKWGVVMIFTLGSVAPIFSIIGFVVREQVTSNPDLTYTQPSILLWATAEITTGLICVCLPETGALRASRRRNCRPTRNGLIDNSQNFRSNILATNRKSKAGSAWSDQQLMNQSCVELSSDCANSQHSRVPAVPKQHMLHHQNYAKSRNSSINHKPRPQSALGRDEGYHAHVSLASRGDDVDDGDSDITLDVGSSKGNITKTVRIELSRE